MKRILLANDKFKGSLSALDVALAIKKGILSTSDNIEITICPMADGGDGSLEIINHYLPLEKILLRSTDPLGREITSFYFRKEDEAYIELAITSGLSLLKKTERNPLFTSTQGTGTLINHAIEMGAKTIYLFLGGSSTNDAGIGILHELGFRFLNHNNKQLKPIGKNLINISSIISPKKYTDLTKINFNVVTDVEHVLYGKNGAAYCFAKQKGASNSEVAFLNQGLIHFSNIVAEHQYRPIEKVIGGGSAGGIGAGLYGLLNTTLLSGTDLFLGLTQMKKKIEIHDLIITGEGQIDDSSLRGKVISGILRLSQSYNKPTILISGRNTLTSLPSTTKAQFSISEIALNQEDAMKNATFYLEQIGKKISSLV